MENTQIVELAERTKTRIDYDTNSNRNCIQHREDLYQVQKEITFWKYQVVGYTVRKHFGSKAKPHPRCLDMLNVLLSISRVNDELVYDQKFAKRWVTEGDWFEHKADLLIELFNKRGLCTISNSSRKRVMTELKQMGYLEWETRPQQGTKGPYRTMRYRLCPEVILADIKASKAWYKATSLISAEDDRKDAKTRDPACENKANTGAETVSSCWTTNGPTMYLLEQSAAVAPAASLSSSSPEGIKTEAAVQPGNLYSLITKDRQPGHVLLRVYVEVEEILEILSPVFPEHVWTRSEVKQISRLFKARDYRLTPERARKWVQYREGSDTLFNSNQLSERKLHCSLPTLLNSWKSTWKFIRACEFATEAEEAKSTQAAIDRAVYSVLQMETSLTWSLNNHVQLNPGTTEHEQLLYNALLADQIDRNPVSLFYWMHKRGVWWDDVAEKFVKQLSQYLFDNPHYYLALKKLKIPVDRWVRGYQKDYEGSMRRLGFDTYRKLTVAGNLNVWALHG